MKHTGQTRRASLIRLILTGVLGAIGGSAITALLLTTAYLAIGGGEKGAPRIRRIAQNTATEPRLTTPGMAETGHARKQYPTEVKEESSPTRESRTVPEAIVIPQEPEPEPVREPLTQTVLQEPRQEALPSDESKIVPQAIVIPQEPKPEPVREPLTQTVPQEPRQEPLPSDETKKVPQAIVTAQEPKPEPVREQLTQPVLQEASQEALPSLEARTAPKKIVITEALRIEADGEARTRTVQQEETKVELPMATSQEQGKESDIRRAPRGPWVINAVSLLSETTAQSFQDKLKKDGLNAYIDEFSQEDRLWYRVRVGFFHSKDQAQQAAKEISKRYHLQGCMILRQADGPGIIKR